MFRLQRLEITGFKSFADHTELVFTGDGMTAIVGPNGCGKSNVSDAINWVLGEQRVKNLRGGEMKDVIFQGSRNRPPSGMAEVVLHLVRDETMPSESDLEDIDSALEDIDEHSISVEGQETTQPALTAGAAETTTESPAETSNSLTTTVATNAAPDAEQLEVAARKRGKRHWRPSRVALEFEPGETISVTRRLYRSGESEYLLNGRICRLRDIQDLFSGTGLSGAHYAIIEQGRIGQILSAKPMDRRTLIEEAAGITKFRVRQRAAEARLESARGNLRRITDIISEIERQVGSLRRQAAKARRYRAVREELRDLLRRVYVAEDAALTQLLDETRARLAEASEEESALAGELIAREEEAREATSAARRAEDKLAAARALAADAALQRDRRERECAYQLEQVNTLKTRLADLEAEIESLRSRAEEVAAECETLREEEAQLRAASEETTRTLAEYEAAYNQRLVEMTGAEAAIESARVELLTHTAMAERLMEHGRQLEATLERLANQAEGLKREGERARESHEAAQNEAQKLAEEINATREHRQSLVTERDEAATIVLSAREVLSGAEAEVSRRREEFSRVTHRLESLTEIDSRRSHYSQAVQRLLSVTDDNGKDFRCVGTLADLLRVEPQWERAVEGAIGDMLQAVVVPTPDDALRAARWLKANQAGRANFIVAGLHGSSANEASLALAETESFDEPVRIGSLLGAPPELNGSLYRALPRELGARVCNDLEQALALSLGNGETYVTLDGDWCAGGGLIGAGETRNGSEGDGLLAFKRELRELGARAEELQAELPALEQSAREARAAVDEAESAVLSLNDAIGRVERDLVARDLQAAQLGQEIERAARHLRVVEADAARLEAERAELTDKHATAMAEAERAELNRQSSAESVAAAAALLTQARRETEGESERLGGQRALAAAATERRRAATADLRRMEAEQIDLDARIERRTQEAEDASQRLLELQQSIEQLQQGAWSTEEEYAQLEQEIHNAAALLTETRSRADALAAEFAELNRSAAAARERRAALDVERAETTARLGYLRESCLSELNQPLEEVARETTIPDDFALEASRAYVEELRARAESFGAVNMMALEELAEAEERFNFLTTQRQDITDGISSTEEALREIKRRSRERFRQAFEEVNRNFSELFLELFGGGHGEMSMIDADDVLESGIDIVAQPPGKRLQNVLLLSGGEKAMAALALVLAIFRYRPSPFCLLDEVDAPLDEANVGRFTRKIVEMSARTQFLIITHNKSTMEMARALYGVTMEEVGVSKLVSVKFE